MDRYPSTSYPEVRFWCLQTLADAFRRDVGANADVLETLGDEDASRLRATLAGWVAEAAERADPPVPPFVKNKLAQCVALVARAQFPQRWPRFTHEFLDALAACRSDQTSAADMFCRVMDAVDDEIVAGASGGARAAAAAARVKDAMRADTEALRRLTEAWKALIAFPDARVAVAATATARRYVDWMDVGLFVEGGVAGDSVARAARANLGDALDADRRAAACEFFQALVAKGMDHRTKTELIRGLGLVETCAQLNAVSANLNATPDTLDDEDFQLRAAQLAAAVGHELVSCLRAGDAAACADPSEPHAPPPPPETLQTAAGLLDALMPVAVAHARAEDERAVAAALPLCSAYAHRLKAPGCAQPGKGKGREGTVSDSAGALMSRDTGGLGFGDGVGLADGADGLDGLRAADGVAARVVCVNPDTARSALRAIAEACVFRGAFPDERRAGVDFRDGGDPRVREAETETAELRRDLFVVFRSVARVSPAIALGAVREALGAALPADSSAPAPPWQRVEVAVAAVHLLGEGANDPAVKPGADGTAALVNAPSPLGELFAFVVSRWNGVSTESNAPTTLAEATLRPNANPAATHRLVAPVFLETCARYHLAVARNPSALLLPALAAFLDARGARHADPEVAARACYLLARFVKPLRQQIAACLPEALAAMEEVVASAVEPPSDASRTSGAAAVGRGTGGAMANSGNDDRLYAYEALGFLLGTEDAKLPEEAQVSLTEKACARLRARLEAATNGGDAETCARCIVACANVAKGFSSRLATEIRPRLGLALVAGLAPATACLARFDAASDPTGSAGVLRQRVVAYFQRMVQGVGRLAFPYAAPLVDRVRASGSASDLKECFVLCNQLCATFKSELAPFAETVTETLLAQTARALAPFASPDGHTHGVLGMFTRVADVPDALARADAAVAARAMTRADAAAAAAADDAAARNTEESREARELEATLVAHLHALGANGLWGAFEAPSSSVRETALATLAAWAAAHPSAVSRKAALQALHKIAQAWFPDDSRAGGNRGVGERVPGFCQFASDVIVRECCVVAVLRGDLDVRDAAGAAAVGEAVAFQRFALERLGQTFAAQLRDGLLVAQLGLDPSLAAEYVAAVTSTAQTAHRDARAVVARCQKVVQGARPGMRRRPCKR